MDIRLFNITDHLGVSYKELSPKLIKKNKHNKLLFTAETNKGNRLNNEDYYKVTLYPLDSNLIMSIVADGVGGYSGGEIASLYVTEKLSEFFKKCSIEEINDTGLFVWEILNELKKINKKMLDEAYYVGETTLSCSVLNKNNIIIFQIGDSRIYTYNGDSLNQVTKDDSEVWTIYQEEKILKDDLRFVSGNNIITNALGDPFYKEPKIIILDRDYIKALLLTTDGVTDIVSDKILNQAFMKMFAVNPEKITEFIVHEAVNGKKEVISEDVAERILEANEIYLYETNPGKDNATAVLTLVK